MKTRTNWNTSKFQNAMDTNNNMNVASFDAFSGSDNARDFVSVEPNNRPGTEFTNVGAQSKEMGRFSARPSEYPVRHLFQDAKPANRLIFGIDGEDDGGEINDENDFEIPFSSGESYQPQNDYRSETYRGRGSKSKNNSRQNNRGRGNSNYSNPARSRGGRGFNRSNDSSDPLN
ncbi:Hypothetical predicted protein [Mytilus galloprovincialis]|uniref:Uncharacterized protein n=1 Tax=Mytilus galloprovincialis TaxID=29158 RepID=A0A8B6EYW7_MYTGA|nr:Hypothetical predicted protein [Mytilus galloprovincialis]